MIQISLRKSSNTLVFLLLFSSGAIAQATTTNTQDPIVDELLRKLNDHDEIDRDMAIKYLHLDSLEVQPENPMIKGDSSFSFGSNIFWVVSYGGVVNCQNKDLIEYKKESQGFEDRIQLESVCDFDFSGDHTSRTTYKIRDNTLYVYEKYYKIRNEDLVLDKKQSTYSAYRLPDLTPVFKDKALQ